MDLSALALELEASLDKEFTGLAQPDVEALPAVCETAESEVVRFIRDTLLKFLEERALDLTVEYRFLGNDLLMFDQCLYRLLVGEGGLQGEMLTISLIVADPNCAPKKRHVKTVRIDGASRYTSLELQIEGRLYRYSEMILTQSRFLLERGAAWLKEFSYSMLAQHETQIARELYGVIRKGLPAYLAKQVYLAGVDNGRGAHILDERARADVVERLRPGNVAPGTSPLRLLSEFQVLTRDLDHMVAKVSVPQNQVVVVEHTHAPYSDTGILEANLAVFRSKHLVVQPLVTQGKSWLLAMYAPQFRSEVEPVLEARRREFQRVVESRGRILDNVAGALVRAGRENTFRRWVSMTGLFLGNFASGFFPK